MRFVVLFILCLLFSTSVIAAECSYSGSWESDWGEMVLVQSGSSVYGDYDWDEGRISGSVEGGVLRGTWSEYPSYSPDNDAGDVEFVFAEDEATFVTWHVTGFTDTGEEIREKRSVTNPYAVELVEGDKMLLTSTNTEGKVERTLVEFRGDTLILEQAGKRSHLRRKGE